MIRQLVSAAILWAACFSLMAQSGAPDGSLRFSDRIFLPRVASNTGAQPWSHAMADVNADGNLDVVTISRTENAIYILLNDGKGKLQAKGKVPTGSAPRAICAADFNKDGKIDVATVSMGDGKVNVHLGTGAGFGPAISTQTGAFPHDVEAADVDGDGYPDLVVVSNADNKVCVHRMTAAGKAGAAEQYNVGRLPRSVAIADLTGDGQPELVIGSDASHIDIYQNLGNGKYGNHQAIPASGATWGLALADVSGDKVLDIVVATYESREMCVYKGTGGLNFGSRTCVQSGNYNFDLVAQDFDLDGDLDVATVSTRDNCLNLHLNTGDGFFLPGDCQHSGEYVTSLIAFDVDNDEDFDIVTTSINDSRVNMHRNIPKEVPLPTLVRYYGRVTDEGSGEPLRGVVNFLTNDESRTPIASVMTNRDGTYEVKLPVNRNYELVAGAAEYPRFRKEFRLPRKDSLDQTLVADGVELNIKLKHIDGVMMYGVVADNETSTPIPNAEIYVKDPNTQDTLLTARTDEEGKYEVVVPFGAVMVDATHMRYGVNTQSAVLTRDMNTSGKRLDFLLGFDMNKAGAYLAGQLTDAKTGKPIADALVRFITPQGRKVKVAKTNAQGQYEVQLPQGPYNVDYNAKGFFFRVDEVTLTSEHKAQESPLVHDVKLQALTVNASIVLSDLYFDVNKASLRRESQEELNRMIFILQQNPSVKVRIGGHTDSDGTPEANLELSKKRAQAVVNFLRRKGIDEERLEAVGYGATKPIAANDTPENKQKNRRTEFTITSTTYKPYSWEFAEEENAQLEGEFQDADFGGSSADWGDTEWGDTGSYFDNTDDGGGW